MKDNIKRKTWKEFGKTGLLGYINTVLHVFGWAIIYTIDNGEIIDVYPARIKFRGFSEYSIMKGCTKLTNYMKNNVDDLIDDLEDNQ